MQELPISQQQLAKLMHLAGTPTGKRLLNMLQQENGPALQAAMHQKDYERAKEILHAFMEKPEVKILLKQLEA